MTPIATRQRVANNAYGVYDARGVYEQRIDIDAAAAMVIVEFSLSPVAGNLDILPLTARASKRVPLRRPARAIAAGVSIHIGLAMDILVVY